MIHGLDTGFLVAAELAEHVEHGPARQTMARLLTAGDLIGIAPQVLAEFIRVATDPRRFSQPLDMGAARQAGIRSLLTTNPADFGLFGAFTCITPQP